MKQNVAYLNDVCGMYLMVCRSLMAVGCLWLAAKKLFWKNIKKSIDKPRKKVYTVKRCEKRYAPLAQLVEHLTLNQGVHGSSP